MSQPDPLAFVLETIFDPRKDFIEAAHELGIPLVEFLELAESEPVIQAIEALERLSALRARAIIARSCGPALETLIRLASDPSAPTETIRKSASQILRLAGRANNPSQPPDDSPPGDDDGPRPDDAPPDPSGPLSRAPRERDGERAPSPPRSSSLNPAISASKPSTRESCSESGGPAAPASPPPSHAAPASHPTNPRAQPLPTPRRPAIRRTADEVSRCETQRLPVPPRHRAHQPRARRVPSPRKSSQKHTSHAAIRAPP